MDNSYDNEELNRSLQDLGAQLVKSELCKKNKSTEVRYVNDEFSVLTTKFNERNVVLFLKTVVFPMDYEEAAEKLMSDIEIEYMNGLDKKIRQEFDVYVMGLGAVQKYVDSDEEKAVFRIGGKYAGAFGTIRLIQKAAAADLGYSLSNPLPVDSVATEYAMLKDIIADNGIVTRKNRAGSMHSSNGHIIDKWIIDVADFDGDLQYRYVIYMDPYSDSEISCLKKITPESTFGEWTMPEGFRSVWLDEE